MKDPMTSTDPNAVTPEPTVERMLEGVATAMRAPRPIGMLMGEVVYLNMWDGKIMFGDVTCSVDHPYLAGTPIQKAALEAMGVDQT